MSDLFGLLSFPAPVPAAGAALTDPALDMVLAFMKAVINADVGAAWAARCPTDPTPVAFTFNHNPDLESFNTNETPAIYAWRADDNGTERHSQDLVVDSSGFNCLWVPPTGGQEDRRSREAIRNGIKKSLRSAFAQGRHPAWVLAGDTYYEPEDYGSVLLKHTNLAKIRLGAFRAHELVIDSPDRSMRLVFDCLFFNIEAVEFLKRDELTHEGFVAFDHIEGTVRLPPRKAQADRLDVVAPGESKTYHLEIDLVAPVSPTSGPVAGGTVVTITGRQFSDVDYEVRFGTALATDVTFIDESTITATTPAHSAGAVDVTVLAPTGIEKTLSAAFTYV
jgi:hypothetical protein